MKVAMIFPTRNSEKAISGYSSTLTESMKKQGINVYDFNYVAGKPMTLLKKLPELSKYDIVHIQHEYNLLGKYGLPFFAYFAYILFSKKNKLVTTMHTVLSLKEKFDENKIKTFLRKTLYFFQNRIIKFSSDIVIVHADFFKKILVEDYGFDSAKIEVLPQGIIDNIKTLSKQKAKKKFNLQGNVYTFMGSVVPDHGHDLIINQTEKIGKTILVVANPITVNTDRNQYKTTNYLKQNIDYVKRHNLGKFVRFDILDINDKQKEWWEYFSASDLILLPYRGGIGSGIFAHAMAMRKPVIASNIKYFSEISKSFSCLAIAKNKEDFPNTIKKSMKPNNYKKMIKECERYVKENSLSTIVKKYKELYLLLIGKN